MVLRAFVDDSYDDEVFTLAGFISDDAKWASFSTQWESLLSQRGILHKDGYYHFKMSEMNASDSRRERLPLFFRVIADHVLCAISCSFRRKDLLRAKGRIHIPDRSIEWGFLDNYYMVAFRCLMDTFHNHRDELTKVLDIGERVDFIFDEQSEKKAIWQAWEQYLSNRPPGIADLYGSIPRFEPDHRFLPLQAADFWAWWSRDWFKRGLESLDFRSWKADEFTFPRIVIGIDEDTIAESIKDLIRTADPSATIIDLKDFSV